MNKKSVLAQRTLLASIIFLLIAASCVVAFADYTELNISPVKQEKSNWCWVAAGQMAGSYINPSVHRSQSEICSHVKGNTNDSTGSYLEAASAMAYAAGNSRRAGGSLVRWSWSQVIEAINKGYPVVLLASDNLIDGHFYLMRGYEPLKKYAALNDPATGNRQVCNWSDFNAGRWAYDSRRYAATCYFEMN